MIATQQMGIFQQPAMPLMAPWVHQSEAFRPQGGAFTAGYRERVFIMFEWVSD
jgi:hypothetical protein